MKEKKNQRPSRLPAKKKKVFRELNVRFSFLKHHFSPERGNLAPSQPHSAFLLQTRSHQLSEWLGIMALIISVIALINSYLWKIFSTGFTGKSWGIFLTQMAWQNLYHLFSFWIRVHCLVPRTTLNSLFLTVHSTSLHAGKVLRFGQYFLLVE